ncbi:hypothetical protein H0176_00985 [Methylorubrum populi]|uniref:RelA/SpoT domain-containing protein n=1 Tax=Methylorubrum rhodesianum TaxID=29427 RepID=A0ABU9Z522_9HYPH|nr:hypothetical protein [Methylorubrum rhodesianum]MBK3405260.1 hypothetical protein [Methylorubrum rhodesianum]MBY0138850.1 hypothetical protein [Methylorubrum populi]
MPRLEGNDLILRCREVADVAKKAADEDLCRTLRAVGADVRSYAFKERMKSPKAIEKKVRRKRLEGAETRTAYERECARLASSGLSPEAAARERSAAKLRAAADKAEAYDPDHVTDVWGCRYVTLYQSEIPPTVEALLTRLESFNKASSGTVRMKECVIYTNRPAEDPLSIVNATLQIVKRSGLAASVIADSSLIREPENRKSAYSSVHFVFERDVLIEHAGKDEGEEIAAFEIQIRDIFEEGWGEVQHHLLYSGKDNFDQDENARVEDSELWQLHLNALKTFVDGCSQHASIIKRNLEMLRKPRIETIESEAHVKRTEDQEAVVRTLKAHGIGREAAKSVAKAYTLLLAAEAAQDSSVAVGHYGEAIAAFAGAIEAIGERLDLRVDGTGSYTVRYLLETEQAHCTFRKAETEFRGMARVPTEAAERQRQLYEDAHRLYGRVATANPSDAPAKLGLARAVQRLDRTPEGLARAEALLDDCIRLIGHSDILRNRLLPISSRIQKGVVLWQRADAVAADDADAARRFVEQAVDVTVEASDIWMSYGEDVRLTGYNRAGGHKAASNILYYVAQLVKRGWSSTSYDGEVLRKYIPVLEDLRIDPYREYFKTRDNLMQAYDALGERETARNLARETFNELRSEAERRAGVPLDIEGVALHLESGERGCYEAARSVLFPGETPGPAGAL